MTSLPPGVRPVEAPSDVRVFLADLETLPSSADLRAELDHDEIDQAQRYRDADAADRFIRRRWLRRRLLAAAHDLDDAAVAISSDRLGKPSITAPEELGTLSLSTSNAGRHALIAWSGSHIIGIDVAIPDGTAVSGATAEVFMHPAELRAWQAASDQLAFFFRCWTRKEALLKVLGTGFATEPASANALDDARIIDLSLPEGCAGALALQTKS